MIPRPDSDRVSLLRHLLASPDQLRAENVQVAMTRRGWSRYSTDLIADLLQRESDEIVAALRRALEGKK